MVPQWWFNNVKSTVTNSTVINIYNIISIILGKVMADLLAIRNAGQRGYTCCESDIHLQFTIIA